MNRGPRGGGLPPDMRKLMQQAAEMQSEMAQRQDELSRRVFEGSSGGGVVTARVKGSGEVVSVEIDPSVVDPDDTELLGDLVSAAVNAALAQVAAETADSLGALGGLDLGGMLG